jgi:glutamate 5-kinase
MAAKLKAARLATEAGIPMQIAHGRQQDILVAIARGEANGTTFHP